MKINPMLKKELKLSVRSPRLSALVVIFNTLLLVIGSVILLFIREVSSWTGNVQFRYNIYMYIFMAAFEFILLMFMIPTITAGLISGEREKQTLDILLTSGLKPSQIISGKLFAVVGNILLIIVSGFPVIGMTFVYGGIDILSFFITLLYFVFSVLYIGSIGIFCSSLLKRTTFASLLSYGIELALIAAPFIIVYGAQMVQRLNSSYTSSNIGMLVFVLFLSPGVTFAYVLFDSVASLANADLWLLNLGMSPAVVDHFTLISIIIQCVFICVFLILAVYYLKDKNTA